MYERVLVPLDGSPVAEAILPFIEQIAGPLDLEVVLLRVVPRSSLETMEVASVARAQMIRRNLYATDFSPASLAAWPCARRVPRVDRGPRRSSVIRFGAEEHSYGA